MDSVFFVAGTADGLASPSEAQRYFSQVPDEAASAAVVGDNHFSIGQAGNRKQGYITARLKYTLEGRPVRPYGVRR